MRLRRRRNRVKTSDATVIAMTTNSGRNHIERGSTVRLSVQTTVAFVIHEKSPQCFRGKPCSALRLNGVYSRACSAARAALSRSVMHAITITGCAESSPVPFSLVSGWRRLPLPVLSATTAAVVCSRISVGRTTMATALLIVDVQNDFTEGGALAVQGGSAVAERIGAFLSAEPGRYDLVLASRDWHDADSDNGGHFTDEPDFATGWPVHCVAGTPGAEYHPAVPVEAIDVHILKGQGRPSYSAFEGVTDEGESLSELLTRRGVTHLDVVGLATDYCVRASVLDAQSSGLTVRVLDDLIAGVSPGTSAAALRECVAAGVLVESSS